MIIKNQIYYHSKINKYIIIDKIIIDSSNINI